MFWVRLSFDICHSLFDIRYAYRFVLLGSDSAGLGGKGQWTIW